MRNLLSALLSVTLTALCIAAAEDTPTVEQVAANPATSEGKTLVFQGVEVSGNIVEGVGRWCRLTVKTKDGTVVENKLKPEGITFVVSKNEAPEMTKGWESERFYPATLTCKIEKGAKGGWLAVVKKVDLATTKPGSLGVGPAETTEFPPDTGAVRSSSQVVSNRTLLMIDRNRNLLTDQRNRRVGRNYVRGRLNVWHHGHSVHVGHVTHNGHHSRVSHHVAHHGQHGVSHKARHGVFHKAKRGGHVKLGAKHGGHLKHRTKHARHGKHGAKHARHGKHGKR